MAKAIQSIPNQAPYDVKTMQNKIPTPYLYALKSLINEQGGVLIKITLKQACSFIRDFRVPTVALSQMFE